MLNWERPSLQESGSGDKRNGAGSLANLSPDEAIQEWRDTEPLGHGSDKDNQEVIDRFAKSLPPIDKEAHKDLDAVERRGMEGVIGYQQRREAGMPPKDEWNDPKSRYSREAIEDGLLARETKNGVEYGILVDKHGEVIAIQKGIKSSVGQVAPLVKDKTTGEMVKSTRDGIMTHTHPSDVKDNPVNPTNRQFGVAFSQGDIRNHGVRETAEIRAVAREGVYILRGNGGSVPDDIVKRMEKSASGKMMLKDSGYYDDKWQRNRVAANMFGEEWKAKLESMQSVQYAKSMGVDKVALRAEGGTWFSHPKFVASGISELKAMAKRYGYEVDFKARSGYEAIEQSALRPTTESVKALDNWKEFHAKPYFGTDRSPVDKKGNTIPISRTQTATVSTPRPTRVTATPVAQPTPRAEPTPSVVSTPSVKVTDIPVRKTPRVTLKPQPIVIPNVTGNKGIVISPSVLGTPRRGEIGSVSGAGNLLNFTQSTTNTGSLRFGK